MYSETFPLEIREKMFVWGSVTKVDENTPATYRGKEISMIVVGNRDKCKVTQKEFIEGIQGGKIGRGRGQQPEKLTPSEWVEFRSVSGSLQWLLSQTRPEIGPFVSLSNHVGETTFKDLQRLYEAVEFLKETRNNGIVYQDLPLNFATKFVTYTDRSFANADLKSQYACVSF